MKNHVQTRTRGGVTRYVARWTEPDTGTERSKTFDKERDAKNHLLGVGGAIVAGTYVPEAAGKVLFRTFAVEWQDSQRHYAASTAIKVKSYLDVHVIPAFGDLPIGSIRKSHVEGFVKGLIAADLSPRYVRNLVVFLRTLFNSAVADGFIAKSPATGVKLPPIPKARVKPPTTEQVNALVHSVEARYEAAIVTLAGTGLRFGELAGLRVEDVDFLRRSIHVEQQLLRSGAVALPKNDSRRTIPLAAHVGDALAAHLAHYPAVDLGDGQGALVFRNRDGRDVKSCRFRDVFDAAAKLAKLTDITPHDLRHYYASLLIRRGLSVVAVQSLLGHKDASTTLDTYSHLWDDDNDRARDAIEDELGKARRRRVAS